MRTCPEFLLPTVAGLLVCSGLQACASSPGAQFSDLAAVTQKPAPEVGLNYYVLSGEVAAQRGLNEEAARQYLQAAKLSQDPVLAGRAAKLALSAGALDVAREAAQIWSQSDPDQAAALELLARMALRANEMDAAAQALAQFVAVHPKGVGSGLTDSAIILAGETAEPAVALSLMNQLVEQWPEVPESWFAQAMLALRLDDQRAALAAVERAMQMRPDWREAQLLALRVALAGKEVLRAGQLIQQLHAGDPGSVDLRMTIGRLLLDAEQYELADREFASVLEIVPDDSSALYALGLLAIDRRDHVQAKRYFKRLFRQGERRDDAAYYLGRIAEGDKDWQGALRWYGRVGAGSRAVDAGIRAAIVRAEQGDLGAARGQLEQLRVNHRRDELRLFQAEAEILFHATDYGGSVNVYAQALGEYPDDPDLLYGRALAAERATNFELAESDLRRMVELNPDDARALNALGYILSNHSDRYTEARQYIATALAMAPDDAAVIDSMGWVEFRLGNLELALRYLADAHRRNQDPEIAAHFGEVLWVLGKRDEAISVWEEALGREPSHPVLQETVQRLRP